MVVTIVYEYTRIFVVLFLHLSHLIPVESWVTSLATIKKSYINNISTRKTVNIFFIIARLVIAFLPDIKQDRIQEYPES